MSKKKNNNPGGIVFSTNPDFKFESGEGLLQDTIPPDQQKLKVRLDTKQRAGKAVTLIDGFKGRENDLDELGKKIRSFCGTGGSAKDEQVIIQGDQREKVVLWLVKNGYKNTKKV